MAAKLTYSEQLKHPNWQRKRLEILKRDGFECTECGDKETTLHVHHTKYIKGRMAWDYDDALLATLCETCHQKEHTARALLDELVAAVGSSGLDMILGLSAGYLLANMDLDRELAERIYPDRELYFEVGLAATVLDSGKGMQWRDVVMRHVKAGGSNPVLSWYAEQWEAQDAVWKAQAEAANG